MSQLDGTMGGAGLSRGALVRAKKGGGSTGRGSRGSGGGSAGGGTTGGTAGPRKGGTKPLQLAYVTRYNHSVTSGTTWSPSSPNIQAGDFVFLRDHAFGGFQGWLSDPGAPLMNGVAMTRIRNHLQTFAGFWPVRECWSWAIAGTNALAFTNLIQAGGGHSAEHSKRQAIIIRPSNQAIATVHVLQSQFEGTTGDPSADSLPYGTYDGQVPLIGLGLVGNWHSSPAILYMQPPGNAKDISSESFFSGNSWMGFGLDIINATGDKATTVVDQTDANEANFLGSLIFGFNRD